MFYFFVVLYVVLFIFLGYFIYLFGKTGVPFMRSRNKAIKVLLEELSLRPEMVFYDLGCGLGDVVFAIEKRGVRKAVGLEISQLFISIARLRAFLKGSKAIFLKKDFFQAYIKDADVIYVFLTPRIAARLAEKILKDVKKGCIVISLGNTLPGLQLEKELPVDVEGESRLFFYKR